MTWESLTNPDARVTSRKTGRRHKNRKYVLNNKRNNGVGNFIADKNPERDYKLRLRENYNGGWICFGYINPSLRSNIEANPKGTFFS